MHVPTMISDATGCVSVFRDENQVAEVKTDPAKTPRRRSRLASSGPQRAVAREPGGRTEDECAVTRLPRPVVGRPGSAGLVPNAARVGPLRVSRAAEPARAALPHRGLSPRRRPGPRGSPREQYRGSPARPHAEARATPPPPAPRALAEGVEPQAARDSPAGESERGGR